MKNKFAAVLLAVAMTVFGFTSCEGSRYSVLRSGKSELYSVACVSVPFLKDDPNWDIVEEIEKDSYGRIMFKCSSNSKMLYDYCGEKLQAMVICQKYDDEYSYYYDNYSFIYLSDDETKNDIDYFKFINDWDKELDPLKMSKVKNTLYPFSEYNAYKEESVIADILKYLSKFGNDDTKYYLDLFSLDNYKKGLLVIREYSANGEKYVFYNSYLVVCDENYEVLTENSEPCILKIEDIVNCQNDLKIIKEQCGWNVLKSHT